MHWAPPIDELRFGLDPLSAFFAVPLLVLGAICGVYGAFYLDDQRERRWLAAPACFYNLLVGSMVLVLLARDAIGLLIAWELMTLASYALVAFDYTSPEVRRRCHRPARPRAPATETSRGSTSAQDRIWRNRALSGPPPAGQRCYRRPAGYARIPSSSRC